MKSLLSETISIIVVSLFWALVLPAAAVIHSFIAGWEKTRGLISRSQSPATTLFASHLTPASR
jgi:hypothetical protein